MNKKTLYHFILDKSGSMSNCRTQTVQGFNSQLETIKSLQREFPEQDFAVSLSVFDNLVDHIVCNSTVPKFRPLHIQDYQPNGQTALLDAIGESVNKIRIENESEIIANRMSVVVVILTDGQENASRTFTYHQIAAMIESLEETGKWNFTFLGADIDAAHTSKMLNIRQENVVSFDKRDLNFMMADVSLAMRHYSDSKASGNVKKDFLDFIDKRDRRQK